MKKVVSLSMGRSSARLALIAIDKFGAENVDLVIMDTGAEHPLTYKFARDMVEHFDIEVTCLRGDFSKPLGKGVGYNIVPLSELKHDLKPFSEMMVKYGTPYIGGMFCTDRMKLKPYKKYCDDKYGKKNYETYLGIRADEVKRIVGQELHKKLSLLGFDDEKIIFLYYADMITIAGNLVCEEEDDIFHEIIKRRTQGIKYLAEICDDEKQDILNFWKEQAFDLEIEEWNGNCVFCPKKSDLKLAAAQRDNPELYADWLDMLYSDSVRVDNNTGHWSKMYRGKQSLEQLIAKFDGSTGAEIKARIRGGHYIDTNSCSESCEVFSGE